MDYLSTYYEQISKYTSLSREEEHALFKEYYDENTSEARRQAIKDKIIKSNLRFAFNRAKKYSKNEPEQFEELIAAGNEGLLVGFEKYDPDSGVKFLSYAGWWVLQRILNQMSKFRVVSLPIWKQQLSTKINRYIETKGQKSVTLQELYEQFPKSSPKDIKELYETRYLTYFLDDLTSDDSNQNEFSDPESGNNPLDQTVLSAESQDLIDAAQNLPEPHRTVVFMLYGLDRGYEYSVKSILTTLDIDRPTFKDIKEEALEILRELLI